MSKNEYDYPEIYAAENDSFKDDFNVFIGIKTSGIALDLACGNGRLTIELAKSGLKVVGLEISQPMIDYAIKKSTGLDINYVHSDIRNFKFNTKFDLVTMAGNSFQALLTYEEQLNMLACVRDHLKPDGIFIFDTRRQTADEMKTTIQYEHWHDFTLLDGEKVQVYGKQSYNEKNNQILYKTKRIFTGYETITETKLLFTDLNDLKKLITKSGLDIIKIYGDFNNNPINENNSKIICLCKVKN